MKNIGIFICNFNKKEYLIQNIKSLETQSIRDEFDIIIIDNASIDGSADTVEKMFPDVEVIRNKENLGGAGGFNLAQRIGKERGYGYILLADNDISADYGAVEALYKYLEEHKDVGIVGAKIYLMDKPEKIWIYGNYIDFDNYAMIDGYANQTDNETIPKVVECQTVPACFFLMRTDCLEYSGYIPKDNFIMWDDIEFCYRLYLSKYKIVAIDKAKVWHKTGGSIAKNHFPTYYYNRNKWNFFSRFILQSDIDRFINSVLDDLIVRIWGLMRKGYVNHASMLVRAFFDYLKNKRGKISDDMILPFDNQYNGIIEIIEHADVKKIYIDCSEIDSLNTSLNKAIDAIIMYLKEEKNIKIYVVGDVELSRYAKEEIKNIGLELIEECDKNEEYVLKIRPCEHIRKIESYFNNTVFVDIWGNIVKSEEEYYTVKTFEKTKDGLKKILIPIMREAIDEIRGG